MITAANRPGNRGAQIGDAVRMEEVWALVPVRVSMAGLESFARRAEAVGFDGLFVTDNVHDGLLGAQVALSATTKLRVATAGLVAFARSPMSVAVAAWDLQEHGGGRFRLGLGPLVRPVVVDRYSVPWSPPAPRMREYVDALRMIFACWQDGAELRYLGEHYRFTKMQDFVKPDPLESGPPPILLAGIGPNMSAVAGEVADGLLTHPTNSDARFLCERTRPWIDRGLERRSRPRTECRLTVNPFCATGRTQAEVDARREEHRRLLGMLYSTREYAPTLELHGWEDCVARARALVWERRWDELGSVVTDEMLDAAVPAAVYDELADVYRERFVGVADAVTLPLPDDPADDDRIARVIDAVRQ